MGASVRPDPVADYLAALKPQENAAPDNPVDEYLAALKRPKHDYHAEAASGALKARMDAANARDVVSANDPDQIAVGGVGATGRALAATGANIAEGIPGMERLHAAIGTVGTGDTYKQSLNRLRGFTGKIPETLKTAERIAGAIPLLGIPGASALNPVAAGAIFGGADQALAADEMTGKSRVVRTGLSAAAGAVLPKALGVGGKLATKVGLTDALGSGVRQIGADAQRGVTIPFLRSISPKAANAVQRGASRVGSAAEGIGERMGTRGVVNKEMEGINDLAKEFGGVVGESGPAATTLLGKTSARSAASGVNYPQALNEADAATTAYHRSRKDVIDENVKRAASRLQIEAEEAARAADQSTTQSRELVPTQAPSIREALDNLARAKGEAARRAPVGGTTWSKPNPRANDVTQQDRFAQFRREVVGERDTELSRTSTSEPGHGGKAPILEGTEHYPVTPSRTPSGTPPVSAPASEPEQLDVLDNFGQSVRTESDRLRASLSNVSDDEIEAELARLGQRQGRDRAASSSFYEHPDTEAGLDLRASGNIEDARSLIDPQRHQEAAFAQRHADLRQRSVDKLQTELDRRAAAMHEMEQSGDASGSTDFAFGANASPVKSRVVPPTSTAEPRVPGMAPNDPRFRTWSGTGPEQQATRVVRGAPKSSRTSNEPIREGETVAQRNAREALDRRSAEASLPATKALSPLPPKPPDLSVPSDIHPAVAPLYKNPRIEQVSAALRKLDEFKGIAPDDPRLLDGMYKVFSDQKGALAQRIDANVDGGLNLGRFTERDIANAQRDILNATDRLGSTYRDAVTEHAKSSAWIDAFRRGHDMVTGGGTTSKALLKKSPEAFQSWLAEQHLKPDLQAAAVQGVREAMRGQAASVPLSGGRAGLLASKPFRDTPKDAAKRGVAGFREDVRTKVAAEAADDAPKAGLLRTLASHTPGARRVVDATSKDRVGIALSSPEGVQLLAKIRANPAAYQKVLASYGRGKGSLATAIRAGLVGANAAGQP